MRRRRIYERENNLISGSDFDAGDFDLSEDVYVSQDVTYLTETYNQDSYKR